jgi:hypothetical protein
VKVKVELLGTWKGTNKRVRGASKGNERGDYDRVLYMCVEKSHNEILYFV